MALLFAAGGMVWLVPATAMRIFVDDPAVVEEGVGFLRIVTIAWGFFGGLMVLQGAFRGAGSTRIAMVPSLVLAVAVPHPARRRAGVRVDALDPGDRRVAFGARLGRRRTVVGLRHRRDRLVRARPRLFLRGTWIEGVIEDGRLDVVTPDREGVDDGGTCDPARGRSGPRESEAGED